jgi:hypothetical protein
LESVNLFSTSLLAFISVFALLALLAGVMQLITTVFAPCRRTDPVVVAAITTAVSSLLAGARVTRIEEEP